MIFDSKMRNHDPNLILVFTGVIIALWSLVEYLKRNFFTRSFSRLLSIVENYLILEHLRQNNFMGICLLDLFEFLRQNWDLYWIFHAKIIKILWIPHSTHSGAFLSAAFLNSTTFPSHTIPKVKFLSKNSILTNS